MSNIAFDQFYIKKAFDTWYLNGRPSRPGAIREIIPTDELGRKPSVAMIRQWMVKGAWDAWADELDADLYRQSDKELINAKAQILREHQKQAAEVAKKAYQHLLDKGFDSSASAVQAFFRGLEEQRKIAGFSDLLEKLDKMTNNEVEKEIINLLNRASQNDQVVDGDVEDVPELEDGNEHED